MNKPKKWVVTVETYSPLYDPNYGKQFTICGHGVVHLDGEACECGRQPVAGTNPKQMRFPV
jgi:hypothetical protein